MRTNLGYYKQLCKTWSNLIIQNTNFGFLCIIQKISVFEKYFVMFSKFSNIRCERYFIDDIWLTSSFCTKKLITNILTSTVNFLQLCIIICKVCRFYYSLFICHTMPYMFYYSLKKPTIIRFLLTIASFLYRMIEIFKYINCYYKSFMKTLYIKVCSLILVAIANGIHSIHS